jgi:hypothetical protein
MCAQKHAHHLNDQRGQRNGIARRPIRKPIFGIVGQLTVLRLKTCRGISLSRRAGAPVKGALAFSLEIK